MDLSDQDPSLDSFTITRELHVAQVEITPRR